MSVQSALLGRMLRGKEIVVAPGTFSPAVAKLAERMGFRAAYFSGAAFSSLLALPDLGITTLPEVAKAAYDITSQVGIPLIVDADTGFGEVVNVARAMKVLGASGAAAVHIEDQLMPKRCGHLDGKELADVEDMVKKVVAAKEAAARGPLLIARTDARSEAGLDEAVERGREYVRAGADAVFPEALESRDEFREFRRKVGGPLMANMTEFGKTPFITANEFQAMGYGVVIFPVTAFRAMMKAVERTFAALKADGGQAAVMKDLMTRSEFYDLIDYRRYEEADSRALKAARRLGAGRGR